MSRGNQANIHATYRQTLETVVAHMENVGLTEADFVAMCLLVVFEPSTFQRRRTLNESTLRS